MERLFKYYPPNENSYKSLVEKGLWCHRAENMNDPFDCLGLVKRNFSEEQLNQFREKLTTHGTAEQKKWLQYNSNQLTKLINDHRSKSIEKYAFCALSEEQDNILMWSHYAKAHMGFVVEFEFPELEENHHLQKVNYQSSLPDFDLWKFGDFMTG